MYVWVYSNLISDKEKKISDSKIFHICGLHVYLNALGPWTIKFGPEYLNAIYDQFRKLFKQIAVMYFYIFILIKLIPKT